MLFFTLNREDFSFVIHLDRQPRTSRRREAQTGSRARSGSRSERTLDAVEHSRTLMEWWPFLIFHRGGLRIKVINNNSPLVTGGDDPLLPYLLSHLDHAQQADLLASFILESGVAELESRLRERLDRNAHVRILVGDYLGITDPNALLRLLDLQQGTEGILDVRVFESRGKSFHPKAYIFHGDFPNFGKGVAYVGSSNLSHSALTNAVEWNYRIVTTRPSQRWFDKTREDSHGDRPQGLDDRLFEAILAKHHPAG